MRLVTAELEGRPFPAAVDPEGGLLGLEQWGYNSVLALIEAGESAVARVAEELPVAAPDGKLGAVALFAPIPLPPRNVFCVGVNYREHIDEGVRGPGQGAPPAPVFFTKPWTTLRGDGETLRFPRNVADSLDWEAEIAVVVGSRGRNVSTEEARRLVFGVTLANDLSARDLQRRAGPWGQWFKGKSLDGSCPMGPMLVTLGEFGGEIPDLAFNLRVNGVEKQSTRMSQMIYGIPSILADLSVGLELLPGDIVLTGTPSGVGLWRDPQEFLGDGDEVVVEAEGIGRLGNTIRIA